MTKPGDSLTKKTLHELAKEFPEKTYRELEKYRDADRNEEAQRIITQQENEELKEDQGKEIDYHRYWKKRAQEAEGELSILKGIETNRVKEAQDALANALEVNESHQKLNGKLQARLTELEEENNKMHGVLNKRMNNIRKSGL